jgi:hypothetical protein
MCKCNAREVGSNAMIYFTASVLDPNSVLVPSPPFNRYIRTKKYHNTIIITHITACVETYRLHPLLEHFRPGGCGGGEVVAPYRQG